MSGHITLVAARNDALDTMGAYQWLSLHTLYSTTGANEVSGGTYLRQQITFDVAIDAAKTSLLPITFAALPLGDPIYWVGLWDDVSAGNFLGMSPAYSTLPYLFMCNDTGDVGTGLFYSQSHPFVVDQQVAFFSGNIGTTLPDGIAEGLAYWVCETQTDYFQVSLTQTGGPLDPPADPIIPAASGLGYVQTVNPIIPDGINDVTFVAISIQSKTF
jgi:hypothetical protein